MTHGDLPPEGNFMGEIPPGLYKSDLFRVILCPTGEAIVMSIHEMHLAYKDISEWGIMIEEVMLDQ